VIARLGRLGRFLYDFVIGDDPLIALGVVAGLGLTGWLVGLGVSAWWTLPLAVVAVLTCSVHRAARSERGQSR
jgi:hypothetical protein